MRPLLGSVLLLLALALPSAAAASVGELSSAAPVEAFGAVGATGSHLLLFHHAFENASLSGTVYAGRVVDRQRHFDCNDQPIDREVALANASSGSVPSPITFQLAKN